MIELRATERLIKFIMGMNTGNDQMKTNLLSTDPMVSVNKAYILVLQVERQKHITGEMNAASEASALQTVRCKLGAWVLYKIFKRRIITST